jgi:cytochrome c
MRKGHGLILFALLLSAHVPAAPAAAQLRGHGGPVRSLAVSSDGRMALSGGFDSTGILWDLRRDAAEAVLRFHDSAVNAVALLKDDRAATAGADGRIAVWTAGRPAPDLVLTGHAGPIAALAVSPDGATLASASWDRTIRLWRLAGGEPLVLTGHAQNVNGVAFMPDGTALISAGYDATVRIWPLPQPAPPLVRELPSPLNAVTVSPEGEIAAAGADGKVHFLSPGGEVEGAVAASPSPLVALAVSGDGTRLAAAGTNGAVAIIDVPTRSVRRTLLGPSVPVWSVAFLPDGRTLLAGGADRVIRRWDTETGRPIDPMAAGDVKDPLADFGGDPGAQVFRACVACHALTPADGNRAGPTLHGVFGRRIATLPGYNYSDALRHLDIVWTPETVAKLFEMGPAQYTPGTKMPEQRISAPEDRAALVRFLERATR